ncbi:MAG: TIGR00153 family protein [bacterium]|nr:TIGR00153 family protein [bacterium]MCP5071173.1 TIGR00153 family protein [bacterium]
MSWIDKLVGHSPIGPMQKHMQAAVSCARQIVPLVEAMASGDQEAVRRCRTEIDRLEHEADEIKHEIRSHLPRRLMMAMERRDMLDILDQQDSIADVTQDIAELADQRGMQLPEALAEPFRGLATRVVAACEQGQRVIDELDELIETGFGDREVARVEEMINELGRIETETDVLQDRAARTLFAMEDQLGIGTVYWHQTILWIADLADYAERVGNRLRLLIAR